MKKILFLVVFAAYLPNMVYAVTSDDIFTQQNISGTYVESGYVDIMLNRNAKNVVMDILYNQIVNYIFDNMDTATAKNTSIYMPANIQECDDEYLENIEHEVSLTYSSDVLNICREDVYTKNLEYILKETAKVEKGAYYILLDNMFKNHTKEILELKPFTMDNFINLLAVNKLISFNGSLLIDDNAGLKLENIKCENNHTPVNLVNVNNNTVVDNITINNREFYLKGCIVKNKFNYYKYITMYEKTDNGYNMYMRIPVYKHILRKHQKYNNNDVLFIDVNKLHFNIYEPVGENTALFYDYMVYRKGTYLLSFGIRQQNNIEYIYYDNSENKYNYTENNISLKLFTNMLTSYCRNGNAACKVLELEELIPMEE